MVPGQALSSVTQAKLAGVECLKKRLAWLSTSYKSYTIFLLSLQKYNQNKDQEKCYLGNENAATLCLSQGENI